VLGWLGPWEEEYASLSPVERIIRIFTRLRGQDDMRVPALCMLEAVADAILQLGRLTVIESNRPRYVLEFSVCGRLVGSGSFGCEQDCAHLRESQVP
jgi:hypothetical protein